MVLWLAAGQAAAEDAGTLSLSIMPEKQSYSLQEAASGGVVILARFVNAGEKEAFLAHPAATAPESYDGKGVFRMDERRGSSEILLYITSPGGKETVLRHNFLRGFEPGNRFSLNIPSGGSEEVRLGWLGPYFALGMWDDIKEPIFDERGRYRIRMVYRNRFTKVLSFGRGGDIFVEVVPWTGEVVSDTVEVSVE